MRIPDPETWVPRTSGYGTCFHRALTRWAVLQRQDSAHGFRIAVGALKPHPEVDQPFRNIHAWLERDGDVISAATGEEWDRDLFYIAVGIEASTVRLVNPRKIVRAGQISRESVAALLAAWGGRYRVFDGGVIADD